MNYIIGKISYIGNNYILLENNFVGYKINIIHNENMEIDKYKKIYISERNSISNNFITKELYGFLNIKDKIFYEKMISLSGIGHKTAFAIMNNDLNQLKQAIISGNINDLMNFNGVTNKIANILITQLKIDESEIIHQESNKKNCKKDIISTLKALGYNSSDINNTIDNNYTDSDFYFNNDDELTDMISKIIKEISVNV